MYFYSKENLKLENSYDQKIISSMKEKNTITNNEKSLLFLTILLFLINFIYCCIFCLFFFKKLDKDEIKFRNITAIICISLIIFLSLILFLLFNKKNFSIKEKIFLGFSNILIAFLIIMNISCIFFHVESLFYENHCIFERAKNRPNLTSYHHNVHKKTLALFSSFLLIQIYFSPSFILGFINVKRKEKTEYVKAFLHYLLLKKKYKCVIC